MKFSFLALILVLLSFLTLQADEDIIEHAAAHPRGKAQVQQLDGSFKVAKYGDPDLERAEDFLSGHYPRPWTVSKAVVWFHETTDVTTQTHLLRLLAASRDSDAALVLGAHLHSPSLAIRIAAGYGLLDYFLPAEASEGGTEQHLEAAGRWFVANKDRLQKEAAR